MGGWLGFALWWMLLVFLCSNLGDYEALCFDESIQWVESDKLRLHNHTAFLLCAFLIAIFSVIWICSYRDKKAFLVAAMLKLEIFFAMVLFPVFGDGHVMHDYGAWCWAFFSILMVAIA